MNFLVTIKDPENDFLEHVLVDNRFSAFAQLQERDEYERVNEGPRIFVIFNLADPIEYCEYLDYLAEDIDTRIKNKIIVSKDDLSFYLEKNMQISSSILGVNPLIDFFPQIPDLELEVIPDKLKVFSIGFRAVWHYFDIFKDKK